ncbi:hypothetical protein D4764_11G0002940 [Takifugu flavidus]|uniref:Uncharacterized protein n=1 Tax=Takifugu flavidus TaxID=433684 RepID=A0A5C6PF57_9TELE|nr:hypothetical protein D4764_11G0002940 [Takifugu flavidus]
MTFISTQANRNSGRQGSTGNSPFFRLRAHTKSVGFRLGDWVDLSQNAEPRGRTRTLGTVQFRVQQAGMTERGLQEMRPVMQQSRLEMSSSEVGASRSSQDQVSGVELTGWEWLAGRVEQRQGEWKITEAERQEGTGGMEL